MKRFTNAALVAATLGMALASAASAADAVIVGCAVDSCPQSCGKTVCQPTTENRTVIKRVYTTHCKEVCMPCSLRGLFGRGCGCDCGCVKVQRDLVVKLKRSQECVKKCVPVHEAACTTCAPSCPAPCAAAPAAPAYMPVAPAAPAVIGIPTMPAVQPSGK